MRAHYLQHVPFEGLGSIHDWLERSGYDITCTPFYQSEELPEPEAVDLLVILGGPMSVNDEETYPWLLEEKTFIKRVVLAGRPVLGICLGAQLIASAMGAAVSSCSEKEIGWFPVRAVKAGVTSAVDFPDQVDAFHWHGETFDVPRGGVRIAESEGCKNQAFQLGRNVIGLQFHLETTPSLAQAIVDNCRDELVVGRYIQAEADILSVAEERYASINRLMESVLEYLHASQSG